MPPPPGLPPDLANLPGLAEIVAAAAFHNIPIKDTLRQVADLLATNPAAVQEGSQTLETVLGGLTTDRDDLERAGSGVLSAGFGELAADVFGPRNAEMVTQVGETGTLLGELATRFGAVAQAFAASHQAVIAATGLVGGQLRITNSV